MEVGPAEAATMIGADVAARDAMTFVAVDGHSAAGKSTLATALARQLETALIAGDDFYRPMDPEKRARLTPEEGAALYYDWQRLRRDVLEPLRRGEPATFSRYDWQSNSLTTNTVRVEPTQALVVEGLFVSRPELADLYDISVLVETPAEVRRQRQLERGDSSVSWIERWDAAEVWFFANVRRRETFDYCVTGPVKPLATRRSVRTRLQEDAWFGAADRSALQA